MAPLRSSRTNRNQGDDETSILKGLPIRQWRLTETKIGPPPQAPPPVQGKQLFGELPLPRDFHMLPEISQQMLRRARQGNLFRPKTPPPPGSKKESKGNTVDADGVFISKRWSLIPRSQEAEEPTHLAKRRKGLPPTWGGTLPLVPQTSYRTAKVKKYDAVGTMHVYEVLVPEGQTVEGEVLAEDEAAIAVPVEPISALPGTVVEGIGVVNEHGIVVSNELIQPTPPRRKPPPPRRKPKKGPGRGKKKVVFDSQTGQPSNTASVAPGLVNVPGVATEGTSDSVVPSTQGDTPMPDGGEEEEGDGSGSDADDGEEGDDGREEGELSPSPSPEGTKSVLPEPPTIVASEVVVGEAMEVDEVIKTSEAPSMPQDITVASDDYVVAASKEASSPPELPLATETQNQMSVTDEEGDYEPPPATLPHPEVPVETTEPSAGGDDASLVVEWDKAPLIAPDIEGELTRKDASGDLDLLRSLAASLDQEDAAKVHTEREESKEVAGHGRQVEGDGEEKAKHELEHELESQDEQEPEQPNKIELEQPKEHEPEQGYQHELEQRTVPQIDHLIVKEVTSLSETDVDVVAGEQTGVVEEAIVEKGETEAATGEKATN